MPVPATPSRWMRFTLAGSTWVRIFSVSLMAYLAGTSLGCMGALESCLSLSSA